jgi:broad specificity phosphatase PhoE
MPPALTWLVRHGQSTSNAGRPASGFGELELTDIGRGQAEELAAKVERQPDLLVVSPFRRAQQTADPIRKRWPGMREEIWPIQELTYLSPTRCAGTTANDRRPWVDAYWRNCDPDYVDDSDAESFRSFIGRLNDFSTRLAALSVGYVVIVGHGQFFSAYLLGRTSPFVATPEWMKEYRLAETTRPIANCAITVLDQAVPAIYTAAAVGKDRPKPPSPDPSVPGR